MISEVMAITKSPSVIVMRACPAVLPPLFWTEVPVQSVLRRLSKRAIKVPRNANSFANADEAAILVYHRPGRLGERSSRARRISRLNPKSG
jgi:hypothetical protein